MSGLLATITRGFGTLRFTRFGLPGNEEGTVPAAGSGAS
jgi:hypothetical protein